MSLLPNLGLKPLHGAKHRSQGRVKIKFRARGEMRRYQHMAQHRVSASKQGEKVCPYRGISRDGLLSPKRGRHHVVGRKLLNSESKD